jgi:recombination protein RecA
MLRFFMRHEKSAKIDAGKTPATDKGYQAWCLAGDTMITLADGSQMSIADICESEEEIHVLSYNEKTGKLEPKLVTDRIINDSKPSDFYRISMGRGTFNYGSVTKRTNLWITGEHKIFDENKEWTPVSEIGGSSIWRLASKPAGDSEQVILGSLLGDGSLSKTGHFKDAHSADQADYVNMKSMVIGGKTSAYSIDKVSGFNTKPRKVALTRVSLGSYGKELRKKIYKEKKTIDRNYLDGLNALGIACWFFDDGSLHKSNGSTPRFYYRLHTEGFFEKDVTTIVEFFNENGFSCRSYKRENCDGRVVYFSPSASKFISSLIAPYATEDMKHKLWPEHRSVPAKHLKKEYSLDVFTQEQNTIPWDDLGRAVKKANRRRLLKKYDLTVEDNHNFFANGILVHNCLWGGNPGYAWARKVVRQMDAADAKAKKKKRARASLIPVFAEIVKIAGASADTLLGIRFTELVAVANELDAAGLHREADEVDGLLVSLAARKGYNEDDDYHHDEEDT